MFSSAPRLFFVFTGTATTEIYTLSLHDALPIWLRDGSQQIAMLRRPPGRHAGGCTDAPLDDAVRSATAFAASRSEEHTSELQSHSDLVCRLLLEKKKDM